jgi:hypothetical protein
MPVVLSEVLVTGNQLSIQIFLPLGFQTRLQIASFDQAVKTTLPFRAYATTSEVPLSNSSGVIMTKST